MIDFVEEEEDFLEFVILNGNFVLSIGNCMNCMIVVFKFFVMVWRIFVSKSIFGVFLYFIFLLMLSVWCIF